MNFFFLSTILYNFLFYLNLNIQGPQASVEKPFLWAEGRVNLKATLNKSAYAYGEDVVVTIDIKNDSRKIVRKIRVSIFAIHSYGTPC